MLARVDFGSRTVCLLVCLPRQCTTFCRQALGHHELIAFIIISGPPGLFPLHWHRPPAAVLLGSGLLPGRCGGCGGGRAAKAHWQASTMAVRGLRLGVRVKLPATVTVTIRTY